MVKVLEKKILVKPREAAAMLSMSESRVYELIAAGALRVVRIPSVRIAVKDLEKWVEENKK